jgi:L-alanine-DL-glutamate epimerase-like enolase superfamily enzyme
VVPVTAGLAHRQRLVEVRSAIHRRVVNIKAGRVGGYLEVRRVHDVCMAYGVPVWCGGMLETGWAPSGKSTTAQDRAEDRIQVQAPLGDQALIKKVEKEVYEDSAWIHRRNCDRKRVVMAMKGRGAL